MASIRQKRFIDFLIKCFSSSFLPTNLQINEKKQHGNLEHGGLFSKQSAVWIPGESSRTLPVFPNLAQTKLNDLSPCKQLPVSAAGVGLGVTAGKQSDLRLSLRASLCHARLVGYMSAGSGRTRSLEENASVVSLTHTHWRSHTPCKATFRHGNVYKWPTWLE